MFPLSSAICFAVLPLKRTVVSAPASNSSFVTFAQSSFINAFIRHGLYNLGGGSKNALTLRELIGTMEEVSGYQAPIDEENPLPRPVPFNYVSDLGLINQELGWKPEFGIAEGLKTLFV